MSTDKDHIETFVNPAGFIEQRYVGSPPPTAILRAIRQLESLIIGSKTPKKSLVLIDLDKITRVDLSVRMLGPRIEAVKAMRGLDYKKAAVYGPVTLQVVVNTLATVAGKKVRNRIRCFSNRTEAIKWLKS